MRRFRSSLLQFDLSDGLPSLFAIGMLTGAIWYFSAPTEPSFALLFLLFLVSVLLCLWMQRRGLSGVQFAGIVFGIGALVGALSGSAATSRSDHHPLLDPIGPVLVEGWVKSVQPANRGVRLVIRPHAIEGIRATNLPDRIRVTQISQLETEPGRFVRCWMVLRPPPAPVVKGDYAFDRQAWYSGLGAVGYVQGRCRGGAVGAPSDTNGSIDLRVSQWRRGLARYVNHAAGDRAGGFAAALASGDRSFMRNEDQEALRGSGLAHLLAISGLHMGIVGGLMFLITWRGLALIEPIALQWPVKKLAAILALLSCTAYLILSGASVATQRAFIMAFVLFGAVMLDRAALTLRSLAIAMIVIILIAPWSVLTPGFQMSFAATAALIKAYEVWRQRRVKHHEIGSRGAVFWLKSLVVTSVISSLATMPFALYHFDRVAGMGVLANLAAMPIISLISAPSAACALLLTPIGLQDLPLRVFGVSLEGVLWIAQQASAQAVFAEPMGPRMPESSLALFAAVFVTFCLFRIRLGVLLFACSCGLVAAAAWVISAKDKVHWSPSGDVFLEADSGEVKRISVLEGSGLPPLRFSGLGPDDQCESVPVCVYHLGDAQIAVLTQADGVACDDFADMTLILSVQPPPSCPDLDIPIIHWRDVNLENGVSFERYRNGFRKQHKPACGSRPWRLCPPNHSVSEF